MMRAEEVKSHPTGCRADIDIPVAEVDTETFHHLISEGLAL